MLHLAAPLGLLAFAALAVPIALHLVQRPRQVVRLGSLRFLDAQPRRLTSFRLRDRVLLVLRCALLGALALLLAQPEWQPRHPTPARWLLLAPGAALDAGARTEWARLESEGYEPRRLAPDFPQVSEPEAAFVTAPFADGWSLLRELDFRLPAGSRAIVFGALSTEQFQGPRPVLSHVQVTWRATASAPTSSAPARAVAPVRVAIAAAADRAEDARYLRAAVAAIGSVQLTDTDPDWIFQLGGAAFPVQWAERIERGACLVSDAPTDAATTAVRRTFETGTAAVPLRQRVAASRGAPILRDSTGEALLVETRRGLGRHWQFALRFHPDWTDWPHTSAFVAWWKAQLAPSPRTGENIAAAQAAPDFAPAQELPVRRFPTQARLDLRFPCWLLAVALFAAERWLSHRAARPHAP